MIPAAPTALQRPPSDVSAGVGLAGLCGLLVWIAFCRNYPDIAEALALPGPRMRMAGPHAAMAALFFSAVPMILWSLLVDKVHRRPSTGIDWQAKRPWGADLPVSLTKITGLWITWAIIASFYCLARWYWSGQYLFAMEVLAAAAVLLVPLSIPYVLWIDRVMVEPRDGAWHFGRAILGGKGADSAMFLRHWRAWMIKGFFAAFMLSILPAGFAAVVSDDLSGLASNPVALSVLLFELLFVIDVQIGTVGYLLTLRPLDSHIRSGNPFLGAWIAALICYPPLVFAFMAENGILAYEVGTPGWAFWLEGNSALLYLWGAVLVALTALYAWATVAFGIRFSNLTYRGVLTNGPYRLTRHPAYVAKNLFWWLTVLPFLVSSGSAVDAIRNTVFLACVSGIYYWRARTEEAHLLAEDAKYRDYHAWAARHAPVTRLLGVITDPFRRWVPGRSDETAALPATSQHPAE